MSTASNKLLVLEDHIINLYLNIKNRIIGDTSSEILVIDQEKEKIKDIPSTTILKYIDESIFVLINKKIEEGKKHLEMELKNKQPIEISTQLEEYICKIEGDIRSHIKIENQLKLSNEYLEVKLQDYEEMLESYNEMENKIEKYEELILANDYSNKTDKKENEILILRSENSNLKTLISNLELKVSDLENKLILNKKENEKETFASNQIIEKLCRKIKNCERTILKNSTTNNLVLLRESQDRKQTLSPDNILKNTDLGDKSIKSNSSNSISLIKITPKHFKTHSAMSALENLNKNTLNKSNKSLFAENDGKPELGQGLELGPGPGPVPVPGPKMARTQRKSMPDLISKSLNNANINNPNSDMGDRGNTGSTFYFSNDKRNVLKNNNKINFPMNLKQSFLASQSTRKKIFVSPNPKNKSSNSYINQSNFITNNTNMFIFNSSNNKNITNLRKYVHQVKNQKIMSNNNRYTTNSNMTKTTSMSNQ